MDPRRIPKLFAYIDIPLKEPKKDKFVAHDKLNALIGKLELEIKIVSNYLFVGSGNYDYKYDERIRQNIVYHSFFRSNGNIIIPGSTIKGSVRSVLEAISNSCVSQVKSGENYFRSHRRCEFDLEGKRELCAACRLFGTTGYGGRTHFDDALPIKRSIEIEVVKIGDLHPPRISKEKRKFYQNKKFRSIGDLRPERNFRFVEAVKKDSTFKTTLGFSNLSKDEFSLLLHSMGIYQDYMIKVGGAKPRCFGTVAFTPIRLKLLKGLFEAEEKQGLEVQSCLKDVIVYDSLIEKELLKQFKTEINKTEDFCPKGGY